MANILIACEESQEVCKAFREKGHRAFSCDIQPCSGGRPEWHIEGDCLPILNGECTFATADGVTHCQHGAWDLLIAHPPCTYLSRAGASNPYQKWATEDYRLNWFKNRDAAFQFFLEFTKTNCSRVAIENPPGFVSTQYAKPTQYIHPFEFGHPVRKKTGLWLKNLPLLKPTQIVDSGETTVWGVKNPRTVSVWYKETRGRTQEETSRLRSKTFPGIARAMAEQWGSIL